MTNPSDIEALIAEIELMEKEILTYKGKKRLISMEKYFQLIHRCSKNCGLDRSIFIDHI